MIMRQRKIAIISVLLIVGLVVLWRNRYDVAEWVRNALGIELPVDPRPAGVSDLQWSEQNYKNEIAELASEQGVPYEYLMALIVLECGGEKPAGHRYEKHVFSQLQKVRDGKKQNFEDITTEKLQGCDDEALKNLATSWGPFQIMGYKVISMGVNVVDLRNEEDAARHGVEWIKKEYGHFLDKKKWKDAFHYHNTGERFPLSGRSRTHNKYYVSDGVKYLQYFASENKTKAKEKEPLKESK
jgi:hypothetical protein